MPRSETSSEWLGTALEIAIQIESLEHRRKFVELMKGGCKARREVCTHNLNNFAVWLLN